jgi:hypothetical protein
MVTAGSIRYLFAVWGYIALGAVVVSSLKIGSGRSRWQHGQIGGCTYNFKQSARERYKNEQFDPLIIWLGTPSTALKVHTKHGLVPLPSVWSSYANIVYVNCPPREPGECAVYTAEIGDFLNAWCALEMYSDVCSRPVYLTGNHLDTTGGNCLLKVALSMADSRKYTSGQIRKFDIRGVAVGFAPFTPTAIFVGHKSFETANDMNFWSVDRASKPIVCNANMNLVEFLLHDVKLTYVPKFVPQRSEMFEYELCAVTTWDRCYRDMRTSKITTPVNHEFLTMNFILRSP